MCSFEDVQCLGDSSSLLEVSLHLCRTVAFVWVCSFEDVQCLGDSSSLSEICLDGNPIAQDPCYKQIVLRNMQQLKQLDMRRVTVQRLYFTFFSLTPEISMQLLEWLGTLQLQYLFMFVQENKFSTQNLTQLWVNHQAFCKGTKITVLTASFRLSAFEKKNLWSFSNHFRKKNVLKLVLGFFFLTFSSL